MPLHPNLQNVASPDLASRITWVQHNLYSIPSLHFIEKLKFYVYSLDGLPFQNEEFDYVYVAGSR